MKRRIQGIEGRSVRRTGATIAGLCALVFATVMVCAPASASPSTTYWTPCVMDVQPAGVWHLTYDTYSSRRAGGDLPTDLGLTYGLRLGPRLNAEVGFDWFSRTTYPVYLNAKIGAPEGAFSPGSPGINIGIFNVGTKKGVTDQNILHFIIGKTVGRGRLHASYYKGDDKLLVSSTGNKEDSGFMFGFDYGFNPVSDGDGSYNKFVVAGDYASGDNAVGGGGIGLYWYFTRNASLLAGPVWYNDQGLYGKMKWTMQLDVNF